MFVKKSFLRIFLSLTLIAMGALAIYSAQAANNQPITVLNIKGAITPAYSDYLHRGLREAKKNNSQLVLVELDTPGGVLTTTREMAQEIMASDIPVAVFVTPAGAHAASAGTFLLYAAHIAAMSPGTNTGAATPISMMPGNEPAKETKEKDGDKNAKDEHKKNDGTNEERLAGKAIEDTAAFIRSLAELRKRNAEWAEQAVTEADSLIAKEALEKGVINYVAADRFDLLKQIHGHEVEIAEGQSVTLDVTGAPIVVYAPDWRTKLLAILTDPNIAYFLLIIGINGLILEFYNPGTMVAGVIGSVCLVLALMSMHVLPINVTGLIMVVLGLIFLAAEAFMPSFGIMGIGGLIAFVIGSMLLFDAEAMAGIGLDASSIVIASMFSAALIGAGIYLLFKLRKLQNSTGVEAMMNAHATVKIWNGRDGKVELFGETWNARADRILPVNTGDRIKIIGKDNLTLLIDEYDDKTDNKAAE